MSKLTIIQVVIMVILLIAAPFLIKYVYDDCRTNTDLSVFSCIRLSGN